MLRPNRIDIAHQFEIVQPFENLDLFSLWPWIIGQPEGSKEEWECVLNMLKRKKPNERTFKRLGAKLLLNKKIIFWSPKNSNGSGIIMPADMMDDFISRSECVLNKAVIR